MSDITTYWNGTFGDWRQNGADLASGSDLETAIFISVFTDRVLPDGVLPPDGTNDRRGWWADDPARPIGSRVWTLLRQPASDQTLADAQSFLVECVQWLIDDGVVVSFDITTEYDADNFLAAQIAAHEPSGAVTTLQYSWAWIGVT